MPLGLTFYFKWPWLERFLVENKNPRETSGLENGVQNGAISILKWSKILLIVMGFTNTSGLTFYLKLPCLERFLVENENPGETSGFLFYHNELAQSFGEQVEQLVRDHPSVKGDLGKCILKKNIIYLLKYYSPTVEEGKTFVLVFCNSE